MQTEPESVATSEQAIERIGSLADLVAEELAAAAGQAERERDLLLAKKLAELDRREAVHELRLQQLEQNVRERLASLRDGEKGERGEKGEKGEAIKGEKGEQGERGAPGEKVIRSKASRAKKATRARRASTVPDAMARTEKTDEPGERGRSFTIRDTYDPAERYQAARRRNAQCDVVRRAFRRSRAVSRGRAGKPGRPRGAAKKASAANAGSAAKSRHGRERVPAIVEWDIRAKTYEAFPLMSDGTLGAPIPLRALFEQFQAEAR